jgi:hypothetical protein
MAGKKGGLKRHFEGWEAGLVAVVIALTGVFLAVPSRVAPEDVPSPLVDGKLLSAAFARERALAASIAPALENALMDPRTAKLTIFARSEGISGLWSGRASTDEVRRS